MKKHTRSLINVRRIVRTPKFLLTAGIMLIIISTVAVVSVTRYNASRVATTEGTSQTTIQNTPENINSNQKDIATLNSDQTPQTSAQSENGQITTNQNNTSPGVSSSTSAPNTISAPSSATPSSSPSTSPQNTDTPQVTLTYPSSWGQTVAGVMTITATASDSNGVEKIVFMIRKIGQATPVYSSTDTTSPYSASFDTRTLPNGGSTYTVEAQVFDTLGGGNLASYRINIQN
jgi:hypothetical protein